MALPCQNCLWWFLPKHHQLLPSGEPVEAAIHNQWNCSVFEWSVQRRVVSDFFFWKKKLLMKARTTMFKMIAASLLFHCVCNIKLISHPPIHFFYFPSTSYVAGKDFNISNHVLPATLTANLRRAYIACVAFMDQQVRKFVTSFSTDVQIPNFIIRSFFFWGGEHKMTWKYTLSLEKGRARAFCVVVFGSGRIYSCHLSQRPRYDHQVRKRKLKLVY